MRRYLFNNQVSSPSTRPGEEEEDGHGEDGGNVLALINGNRGEALEVVLETVQVEEKPFRALLRKLCKPPMRAEDSTGWNNKEKSSNNPCTCPPPTYNSKFFFLLLHTHHGRMRVSVFYYRVLVSLAKRVYLARLNSLFFLEK